jgi:predicted  nucleic acid-binding Zn-ribbon protein
MGSINAIVHVFQSYLTLFCFVFTSQISALQAKQKQQQQLVHQLSKRKSREQNLEPLNKKRTPPAVSREVKQKRLQAEAQNTAVLKPFAPPRRSTPVLPTRKAPRTVTPSGIEPTQEAFHTLGDLASFDLGLRETKDDSSTSSTISSVEEDEDSTVAAEEDEDQERGTILIEGLENMNHSNLRSSAVTDHEDGTVSMSRNHLDYLEGMAKNGQVAIEDLTKAKEALDKAIRDKNHLEQEAKRVEQELEDSETRANELDMRNVALRDKDKVKQQLNTALRDVQALTKEKQKLEKKLGATEEELETLKKLSPSEDTTALIKDYEKTVKDLQDEISALNHRILRLEKEQSKSVKANKELEEENESLKSQITEQEAKLKAASRKTRGLGPAVKTGAAVYKVKFENLKAKYSQLKEEGKCTIKKLKLEKNELATKLEQAREALRAGGKVADFEVQGDLQKAVQTWIRDVGFRSTQLVCKKVKEDVSEFMGKIYDGLAASWTLSDKDSEGYISKQEFSRIYEPTATRYLGNRRSGIMNSLGEKVIGKSLSHWNTRCWRIIRLDIVSDALSFVFVCLFYSIPCGEGLYPYPYRNPAGIRHS